jgi:hypothetical protein
LGGHQGALQEWQPAIFPLQVASFKCFVLAWAEIKQRVTGMAPGDVSLRVGNILQKAKRDSKVQPFA